MEESRGLCHPSLTGLPSPRQSPSPVFQASAPTPQCRGPWGQRWLWEVQTLTWDGAGHVCPPLLWAVTSPVTVPLLPDPPNAHLQPAHSTEVPRPLPGQALPPGASQPAARGKENRRAHGCEEDVLQLCQCQLTRPRLRAPQDKSMAPGHTGVIPGKQLLAEVWQQDSVEAALLQVLIARGVPLAARGCEQAEGEDEHDGQQNRGCYPAAAREPCDCCERLRGDHVGEIEHVAQSPAYICVSNLRRQRGKRDGKGCKVPGKLEKSLHPQVLLHNHHFCAHLGLWRPQQ